MTILLIEDEPLIAKQLYKLVRQLEPTATIDGPLDSVHGICAYLSSHQPPDLTIADIQLSDGVSFEAFRQAELNGPIIFTTAYDAYALRAFKLNSLDYLLKPIDPDELKAALAKFHRWHLNGADFRQQFQEFLGDPSRQQSTNLYKRRFMGHYLRQVVPVPQEQVAFFTRMELIYLYTSEGQRLITDYKTLDELEDLTDPAIFFRVNRQYLVHLNAIVGYRPLDTGKLLLTIKKPNEVSDLTISKEKAPLFRQWFE